MIHAVYETGQRVTGNVRGAEYSQPHDRVHVEAWSIPYPVAAHDGL